MRTLIISDLHLGNRAGRDVLRRPVALTRLTGALRDVDRLVLLGDTLEYHGRHARRALAAAEPVLRAIGAAMAGGEIVLVPGNHDHDLVRRWVRERGGRLGVDDAVEPDRSSGLEQVLAMLGPAHVTVRYPGVWLSPGVYATHGHYADRHLRPQSAIGRLRRRRPSAAGPSGHERDRRRPARRRPRTGAAGHLAGAIARTRASLLFRLLPLVLRPRMAPLVARTLDRQMRRHAVPALIRVLEDLGIDADYVIFGHVHRLGPRPGDDPRAWGSRPAVLNTGNWQYEVLLAGSGEPPHPYWPGGAILIEDGRAPRTVGLLDDLRRADLDPRASTAPGRDADARSRPVVADRDGDGRARPGAEPATVGGTCRSCSGGHRP